MKSDIYTNLQTLISRAQTKSREALKGAKQEFQCINDSVYSVRNNGEFEAGETPEEQISALSAALSRIETSVRDARLQLTKAESHLEFAKFLLGAVAHAEQEAGPVEDGKKLFRMENRRYSFIQMMENNPDDERLHEWMRLAAVGESTIGYEPVVTRIA